MNTYKLLLLSLCIVQTQLYGAASSSSSIAGEDNFTAKQLINFYTDVFLNEPGAGIRLTSFTRALLSDAAGNVVLSPDIIKFTHTYLPHDDFLKLPAHTIAGLIYLIRNVATHDTPEILNIKKFLYTAVQHNLLHNQKYHLLEQEKQDALENIQYALGEINDQLRQASENKAQKWINMA